MIDRLLALDTEELDMEQIKWVVLMVLSSQPGQELAYARMEDLVFDGAARDRTEPSALRFEALPPAARPRFFV